MRLAVIVTVAFHSEFLTKKKLELWLYLPAKSAWL